MKEKQLREKLTNYSRIMLTYLIHHRLPIAYIINTLKRYKESSDTLKNTGYHNYSKGDKNKKNSNRYRKNLRHIIKIKVLMIFTKYW